MSTVSSRHQLRLNRHNAMFFCFRGGRSNWRRAVATPESHLLVPPTIREGGAWQEIDRLAAAIIQETLHAISSGHRVWKSSLTPRLAKNPRWSESRACLLRIDDHPLGEKRWYVTSLAVKGSQVAMAYSSTADGAFLTHITWEDIHSAHSLLHFGDHGVMYTVDQPCVYGFAQFGSNIPGMKLTYRSDDRSSLKLIDAVETVIGSLAFPETGKSIDLSRVSQEVRRELHLSELLEQIFVPGLRKLL